MTAAFSKESTMQIRKASRLTAFDRARTRNPKLFDRLMQNADTAQPGECWHWRLSPDRDGYGTLKVGGKSIKAHRAMHDLFYPAAILVRHLCHNPRCVNPLHLRAGTPLENAQDRMAAGRGGDLRGQNNGRAKLTDLDVLELRASRESGAELARKFGISKAMACRIKRGAAWAHI
jgi:hypothetical protein